MFNHIRFDFDMFGIWHLIN